MEAQGSHVTCWNVAELGLNSDILSLESMYCSFAPSKCW
jgi:hypothetical protein